MENNVKVLKLITGEEVIARVEQKNTMLILDNPVTMQAVPNQQTGKMGFALIPWLMSGKSDKVSVSIDHVIAEADPKEQSEKNYLSRITGLSL